MLNFQQQFSQAWRKLFVQFSPECWSLQQHAQCLAELLQAYQEPQRAYHQVQHIVECLALFEKVQSQIEDGLALQLAIFFHDVVYQPRSASNEQDSALWLRQQLAGALPDAQLEKIATWILATQQHATASELDLAYLLDIDLAILGSSAVRFTEYQQQIRQEYMWVDELIYQEKRTQVLRQFYLAQPLYQTRYFQQHYEQQAKTNLLQTLN
ncbi:metal-dependent hydrolase [Acinetobacter sp. ANC 4635]|uniref:HD domain-containing protein n=1 Tax=Acinetobacter sp. ANC 4635 TaxID=2529846 RepID=UPI00103EA6B0|nr:metal-dependent hydrolase [Acinetobacter sp. ANC 4635]TCB32681.1 metal-dependent hydrolase [Acinetobacter sp. ANC 4635]